MNIYWVSRRFYRNEPAPVSLRCNKLALPFPEKTGHIKRDRVAGSVERPRDIGSFIGETLTSKVPGVTFGKDIKITADKITIGKGVSFGDNIDINVRGEFAIGDYSRLGDDVKIRGNNVLFGKHLYHSRGLGVGGGGYTNPEANLTIGDRCTIHDNYINIAMPVVLGNDVGLSREVSIQTHGYWLSVLDGFPARFKGVTIGDGVIVGYRATILAGVTIGKQAVVGACSVVTKDLPEKRICVGSPCKARSMIATPSLEQREILLERILQEYRMVARHHGYEPKVSAGWPFIYFQTESGEDCIFSTEYLTFEGPEDETTDHFRDYVRKWGLRFYSERPFRSVIRK